MSRTFDWLGGFLLGAAVMSLADPQSGARRRSLVRGKAVRALHETSGFIDRAARDLRNRACGAIAEAKARRRHDEPEDAVLTERVRSKLGRHAAHPHAIEVEARRGRVTLRGPVPGTEAADLLDATSAIPGVTSVLDRLERQDSGELGLESLAHASPKTAWRTRFATWSPGMQLLAGAGGLLVLTTGVVVLARNRRRLARTLPDYASLVA